jgi:hypothetical protein
MTNAIAAPFVVRAIRGQLLPGFSERWPADSGPFPATLELYDGTGETRAVPVAPDGSFDFAAAEGTYCFRVSSDVLQGYEGTIVVTRSAGESATIRIAMDLGA